MFNREIDVAAIMREIKKTAQSYDDSFSDTDDPIEKNINAVKHEVIRINDFIYNTHRDSESYVEMGKEIPVNMSHPYILRKLLTLYRRLFRKSTRFLALDQKKYNEYVGAEIKALQESQSQMINLIDTISSLRSENLSLQAQIKKTETFANKAAAQNRQLDKKVEQFFNSINDQMDNKIEQQLNSIKKTVSEDMMAYLEQENSKMEQHFFTALQENHEDIIKNMQNGYLRKNRLEDSLYVEFEKRFRGESDDIKKRMQIYIDKYVHSIIRDKESERIIDLGCGRGEFLEQLAAEGYSAEGVDINREMINLCQQKGLSAAEADLFEYLRTLPDNSVKIITAFQVIEHISHEELITLLKEVYRVLDYHGCLILETPNCLNIEVGASNFYSDPTHVRPIYPAYMEFLAQNMGFYETELFYWKEREIEEWMQSVIEDDHTQTMESPVVRTMLESIKKLFYVSPDFAIISTK